MRSIRYIKGIGPKKEKLFNKLGIFSVRDLLYYFPYRYEDRRQAVPVRDIKAEGQFLVRGRVMARALKPLRSKPFWGAKSKYSILEAIVGDDTGLLSCVWFNQGYLYDYITANKEIVLFGKVRGFKGKLQMVSPDFEIIDGTEDPTNTGRIVGFYHLTEGLTQKSLRKSIRICLDRYGAQVNDPLPYDVRKARSYPNVAQSLASIHFPVDFKDAQLARRRFIFEELFFSQVRVYLRKAHRRLQKAVCCDKGSRGADGIRNNLPFSLTESQAEAVDTILNDLRNPYPMYRLLQGDVGSGKTVVACFAAAAAASSRTQVAFMVPTEILVYQHLETIRKLCAGMGYSIDILTSSSKEKKAVYQRLMKGKTDIVIGTHALLEEAVRFKQLGLVIIDEQHKFGVAQRALLPKKGKERSPHCLVMSATPIPRSLALSVYGDLDISVLRQLPPGRTEPETIVAEEDKRQWVYDFIRKKIAQGRQAYIVYPLIEESRDWDLKSVEEMYDILREEFEGYRLAVFHGRMRADEKKKRVREFIDNKIQILISTTVIEVGVNIENAVVMVVEHPERFGLAQLHQLRGRIRRSTHQPYFILIRGRNLSEGAAKRLSVIAETHDGFRIAEEDLLLRGPGDFFGLSQSGYPQPKVADPSRDIGLFSSARASAYTIIKHDPHLKDPGHRSVRDRIDELANKRQIFT